MSKAIAEWSTQDTTLAACLAALGFKITTQSVLDDPGRSTKEDHYFTVPGCSVDGRVLREPLLKAFRSGDLELNDPHHLLLQGHRARRNVRHLIGAIKLGTRIRLAGVANNQAAVYIEGEESSILTMTEDVVQTTDLWLAASLGTVGIPVIKITSNGTHSVFTLPRLGHVMMLPGGAGNYNASDLIQRDDMQSIRLETTQPDHPVAVAYAACRSYGQLKKHLSKSVKLMVLRAPGSGRVAMVSQNATGRVQDRVQRHFRIV